MRIRAGIVLPAEGKVALIERYRAGMHYFVFPGGGVDEGETPAQAAIRELEEETGLRVAVRLKLAVIQLGQVGLQHYFLAERIAGEFGKGMGEEMSNLHPDDWQHGVYIPIWMPFEALLQHSNVYPAVLARLVGCANQEGWPLQPLEFFEEVTPCWPPSGV